MSTLNQCRVQTQSLASSQIVTMASDEGGEPVLIVALGKIPLLSYFANFYRKVIHTADVRATKYPMLFDPDGPAALVLAYLIICLYIGPRFMKNRKTPKMTLGLLLLYNFIAVQMNGFLALTLTYHVFTNNFSLVCQPMESPGEDSNWIMSLLYMFHVSKIVELLDTVFLVWKKKNNQLTFLHFYHHSTIIAATWIGVKFAPGGTTAVIAMINSWVHVFMYIYYQLAAGHVLFARKYKKFMTILQISQFSYTLLVCSTGLWIKPCNYPGWILWWLFLYMLSFLMLFGKFFRETYTRGGRLKKNGIQDNIGISRLVNNTENSWESHKYIKNGDLRNGFKISLNLKNGNPRNKRKGRSDTNENFASTYEITNRGHTSSASKSKMNEVKSSKTCFIL